MKRTVFIMAGGKGERFWPRSRSSLPKQFISLTGDGKTMIQLTVERVLPFAKWEDIYIATSQAYKALVMQQLPDIPQENILCEPVGRNTAPCIGMGAAHIQRRYGDAVMLVLPADHLIGNTALFLREVEKGCKVAEEGESLITLGITPNRAETGYGYIKFRLDELLRDVMDVEQFVEKPDIKTAERYVASGQYLWNSGMFIWKASTILRNLKVHLPEVYAGIRKIEEALGTQEQEDAIREAFERMPSVSIDYGVMEKAEHIYTLAGSFGWDDVGSWLALERLHAGDASGNVLAGNVVAEGIENCTIQGDKRLIAAVGVRNLIVVDTEDALLVCAKDSTGEIKKIMEKLRRQGQDRYL